MDKIMESIVSNSMFGMALSILMYAVGLFLNKKLKTPVCNPLLIAIALVIAVLQVFHIPLESYLKGGDVISMFLAPATAVLAYSIYHQIHLLKKYWLPILVGCLVGDVYKRQVYSMVPPRLIISETLLILSSIMSPLMRPL